MVDFVERVSPQRTGSCSKSGAALHGVRRNSLVYGQHDERGFDQDFFEACKPIVRGVVLSRRRSRPSSSSS